MSELKVCPFCGSKDVNLEQMGFPHHVYCLGCAGRMTGDGFDKDGEKSAIDKWNRRPEEERLQKRIAELEKALREIAEQEITDDFEDIIQAPGYMKMLAKEALKGGE